MYAQIGGEIARDILPQAMSYFLGLGTFDSLEYPSTRANPSPLAGAGNDDDEISDASDSEDEDDEDAEAEIDLEEEEVKRPAKKAKRS